MSPLEKRAIRVVKDHSRADHSGAQYVPFLSNVGHAASVKARREGRQSFRFDPDDSRWRTRIRENSGQSGVAEFVRIRGASCGRAGTLTSSAAFAASFLTQS